MIITPEDVNESLKSKMTHRELVRWRKRKDAPFQKWLKMVKKEQNNYPLFRDKEINESYLRNLFGEGKTHVEALNDLSTSA